MSVKARIRMDYKVTEGGAHFFWQKEDPRENARELRERQVSLLRNLPFQGIELHSVDADQEVYLMPGNGDRVDTAYAPVELVVEADSFEDLMQFTLAEEFRKIKVLEPDQLQFSSRELERFLCRVNSEYRDEVHDLN